MAKTIAPSARGELEITSINNIYMENGDLNVIKLPKDFCWFDTGTAESMYVAASCIREIQQKTKKQIANPEACAFESGFIGKDTLKASAVELKMTEYGKYLAALAEN